MTDNTQTSHTGRRRRVRKRRPRKQQSVASPLGQAIARQVFVAMVAIGVFYGAYALYQVWTAAGPMQGVSLGMTRQDVRYRLGAPVENPQAPTVWLYAVGGNRLTLHFGDDQRVSEVTCEEGASAQQPCTNILGVMIHSSEAAVKLKLGSPDWEGYDHGDNLLGYKGLGVVFTLRQARVTAISLRGAGTFGERLMEAFWIMLP